MIFSRAWRALMRRNFLYRRRKIIGSFFEIVLPILFVALLVWIKSTAEDSDSFRPRTIDVQHSSSMNTMRILSFTDYVTAMQAQRICLDETKSGYGLFVPPESVQRWVEEGLVSAEALEQKMFIFLLQYLAEQNAGEGSGNPTTAEGTTNSTNSTNSTTNSTTNITNTKTSPTTTTTSTSDQQPEKSYMELWSQFVEEQLVGDPDFADVLPSLDEKRFSITGLPSSGYNWPIPFVKCDHSKCKENYENAAEKYCEFPVLAIAPSKSDDEIGKKHAEEFQNYIYKRYPQLLNENQELQFEHEFAPIFQSNEEIEKYVKHPDYGLINKDRPKVALAVIFSGGGDGENKYAYVIRSNSTNYNTADGAEPGARTTPDTSTLFNPFVRDDSESCPGVGGVPYQGPFGTSCTGLYMYNGVLTTQRLIHDFIFEHSGAKDRSPESVVAENGVQYMPFPSPAYTTAGFMAALGENSPLLMILGWLYPMAIMIGFIVSEKELRQKELMKMMSVTESDINQSWFVSFFLFHLVTTILITMVSSNLFSNTVGSILFTFWLFTVISFIVFAQALATLSSKSTRGVLIGILVFFIGFFLSQAVKFDTGSVGLLRLVGLHPAAAFTYIIQEISRLEDGGIGVTQNTALVSDLASGFSFSVGLNMLFFDIIFWGIVSWYLNRVIAPDYGQALEFYFPFTLKYWCPSMVKNNNKTNSTTDFSDDDKLTTMMPAKYDEDIPVEQVSVGLRNQATEGQSIEIHNLRKVFKEKIAVDGLNLSIYSGQITALLGHNGAGKTTTISLLTGALAPTDGYAMIAGNDVRSQLGAIRSNIGICLQHDCLFPQLTVREHIQFFCRLKGVYGQMSFKEAEKQVDTAINDVGLKEKTNTYSRNLSGGMKRKLSVAMAFCGNSNVVILDEPTSGMDPFSRRFTWNVIRQYRQNRCIILTTHFMDEADILGDRIAIMAEGRLRCVGSSLFLKKEYGVGYQLTIDRKSKAVIIDENAAADSTLEEAADSVEMLTTIVKDSVNEAKLLSDVGTELSFQLPLGASSNFVPMLEKLDSQVNSGSINSYGVSITTLDEVFQIIARNEEKEHHNYASSRRQIVVDDGTPSSVKKTADDDLSTASSKSNKMNLEKDQLFSRHMKALLKKRKSYFFRDKKAWCCTTIFPSLCVLAGFLLVKFIIPDRELVPLPLDIEDYNNNINNGLDQSSITERNPILFNEPDSEFTCQPGVCVYQEPMISITNKNQSEVARVLKNESYSFCGSKANLLAESSLLSLATAGEDFIPTCSIKNSFDIMSQITEGGAYPMGLDVSTLNESSRATLNSSQLFAATQYGAVFFTHEADSFVENRNESYADAVYRNCMGNNDDYVDEGSVCERYKGIGYVIGYNFTAMHAAPMYQKIADEAIIREALNDDEFKISATIYPLSTTAQEDGFSSGSDAFIVWFLIVLSFPFIAGAYGTFVVAERESKAKHLQTVAGVKPVAYWLSTLVWDVTNYQIPFWIIIIQTFAFGVDAITTTERGVVGAIIATMFCFGPAAACFAYTLSFAFKSPSLCNVVLIITGVLIGFAGPVTVFVLQLIGTNPLEPRQDLVTASHCVEWICRLFMPTFCLGNALYKTIFIQFFDFFLGRKVHAWEIDMVLIEVIFLLLQTVMYFTSAVLLDILSSNPQAVQIWRILTCRCSSVKDSGTAHVVEDEDVLQEQERVNSGGSNKDLIVLSQLSKVYDTGKVAVDNLSLGIPPGQCFGLLGINGAGKTTTMGMLTAEFPPTSGDATLAGYSVCHEPEKTRRRIGYCPQFDAHFENLTGREHVELYACIKGVPTKDVQDAAAEKLAHVGLSDEDADRITSNYSGGMKRRLSLACATIGHPQIVFLDECSTGVDPVARREIWQMVSDMVSNDDIAPEERTSVILTTHSMEECEALCPRIGIMANGRLRCLGSAQHLKTKFGRGYQVEMTVKTVDTEDEDYIKYYKALVAKKGAVPNADEEEGVTGKPVDIYFNLDEAKESLQSITQDEFLSSKLAPTDMIGYLIHRDATSESGVDINELTSFVTIELRMRNLHEYISKAYPNSTLRERQDMKARYEVDAEGVRILQIFAGIEENKGNLQLSDYGVSQTSLEQVFNMHAAEAERIKYKT